MGKYDINCSEMIGDYKIPPVPVRATPDQTRRATLRAAGTQRGKALLKKLDAQKGKP